MKKSKTVFSQLKSLISPLWEEKYHSRQTVWTVEFVVGIYIDVFIIFVLVKNVMIA